MKEKTQNRDSERQGELTHVPLLSFLSLLFPLLSFWGGGQGGGDALVETEPRALHLLDMLYH